MYKLYNYMLHIVHLSIIGFSLTGFILTDYLLPYLILQFLMLCSWVGYGFYDNRWGRCIITEIQWSLKEANDNRPETESYIQYLLKYKLGFNTNEGVVDICVFAIYACTSIIGGLRFFQLIS